MIILALGAVCFLIAGYRDLAWTVHMFGHPWRDFANFMSRSMFEGELPGGSDLGVLIPIIAFLLWLYRRRPGQINSQVALKCLKFTFLSGLLAPLVAVQLLKLIVSRARPKVYLTEVLPQQSLLGNSDFLPGFMGIDGPRGYSWNSFPSGHASSCAVLLVFVYIFGRTKLSRTLIFTTVFTFTGFMAAARSMDGMHWMSDSVASFFVVWTVVDWLYTRIFSDKSHCSDTSPSGK
ncbi:MAG: phosphatase PAP2 family protein [Proteobacteria bacterium]|nr:phosphatase PAP2 family protein [Pseudomonadota bacterium]